MVLRTIKEFGKSLSGIKIMVKNCEVHNGTLQRMIGDIIEGCPELKTLTLESLDGSDLIEKDFLKTLSEGAKELKNLKIIKGNFWSKFTENDVKKILSNCNVEIEECSFNSPIVCKNRIYWN